MKQNKIKFCPKLVRATSVESQCDGPPDSLSHRVEGQLVPGRNDTATPHLSRILTRQMPKIIARNSVNPSRENTVRKVPRLAAPVGPFNSINSVKTFHGCMEPKLQTNSKNPNTSECKCNKRKGWRYVGMQERICKRSFS